jgi:hypothetical protein
LFDALLGAQKQQGLLLYVEQQPSAVLETRKIVELYLKRTSTLFPMREKKSTPSANAFFCRSVRRVAGRAEAAGAAALETRRIMAFYRETHVNALRHARSKSTPSANTLLLSICSTSC